MKTCSKCKETLPFECFGKRGERGYQAYCKSCNRDHKRDWIGNNRQKVSSNRLWSMYRLRQSDYDEMSERQGGKCAICRVDFPTVGFVDHDHNCCEGYKSCGKCVRGLLCSSCNAKVGWLETRRDAINKYLSMS